MSQENTPLGTIKHIDAHVSPFIFDRVYNAIYDLAQPFNRLPAALQPGPLREVVTTGR